ncbi:MAG TPA: hypothetical protein VKG25_06005 [Bryobacteraceae bacterium]|nr:hypothetical protein [Bryobacteraceae bacterium]
MKKALVVRRRQVQAKHGWPSMNFMQFPQALRDAIPGPDLPGCDRLLVLSSIDGKCLDSPFYGKHVQLKMRVEESGKLTGAFDLNVGLTMDAARALALTLQKLTERAADEQG